MNNRKFISYNRKLISYNQPTPLNKWKPISYTKLSTLNKRKFISYTQPLTLNKWKTIAKIVVPTALSGIVTGIMLALARVMGETAPVLILVGSATAINFNLFEGPQTSLPLMMVDLQKAGTGALTSERMWGAALTLILIIALLNIGAKLVSKFFAPKNF